MNQEEKIKELLAEIKALKEENAEYKKKKDYGLVWDNEKNKEKIVEDCKTKLPILERAKDKEIITDKTKPMNLMIEGDNYHALTCLNYTHKGKIDVIYIDPPYNTGKAKEWKFNDKYVDKEDRFRHSKWLNMMEKRLRLAHNLLTDDGVIFISIDDNEQANLKLLCDEIFEEDNFINNVVLKTKESSGASGGGEDKGYKKNKEFLFVYSKNKLFLELEKKIMKKDLMEYIQERKDNDIGFYYTRVLLDDGNKIFKGTFESNGEQVEVCEHDNFKFENISSIIKSEKISEEEKVYLKYFDKIFMVTNAQSSLPKKAINVANGGKQKLISYKYRPSSGKFKNTEIIKYVWNETLIVWLKDSANKNENKIYKESDLGDLWTDLSWGRLDLEGDTKFKNGKKPVSLIKRLCLKTDSIVLDFFAGSGTTGHAVMELNKEDGGNRKFILCTNNENNNGNGHGGIAEAVCYPRIKKVIKGYKKNGDGEWVAGLGGNLHYFKADENSFISIETLKNIGDKKRLELTLKAGELIAIRENIFSEKEHSKYYQIFEDNHKQVAIYFKEEHTKLNELMEKLDSKKEKIVYLFGWGKTLFSGDDLGYPDITVKDIPEPIIRIYQEING